VSLADAPLLAGILLAWSLAATPGPINALIAHAAARRGFLAGWIYGLGATTGDMAMLLLTAVGVLRVADTLPWLRVVFAAVGAALMAWFALGAWRTARRVGVRLGSDADDRPRPMGREYLKGFLVVTTSPFNWAFWLTAGSSMLSRLGLVLAFGFFAGLLSWTLLWAAIATAGGARIRRLAQWVSYAAAVTLAVFAVVLAYYAVATARSLLA
jgi:threonine/homoserine/homoserine lactone efflux protein